MNLKHLFILLFFVSIFNCENEKKKEDPEAEEIESITSSDSIPEEEEEIDSIIEPAVTKKPVEKKKEPSKVVEENKVDDITEKKFPPRPKNNEISISPIQHATMVIETATMTIYIDPVGGAQQFAGQRPPDFVLITDIHGDHLNIETLQAVVGPSTTIIGPRAVRDKLPDNLLKNFSLIFNGLSRSYNTSKMKLSVEGVAMYNLRKEALQYHEKGRGNGYILTLNGKRLYVSGDTEDILEMRQLKNIDIAFICMNLPYTMTEESAADAVLQFKPKTVYPYHYRGSDVQKFKQLVNNSNPNIKVVLLDWYPPSA